MTTPTEGHEAEQATHDDICDGALRHYNEVSNKASSWMNTIEKAIECYRKFGSPTTPMDSKCNIPHSHCCKHCMGRDIGGPDFPTIITKPQESKKPVKDILIIISIGIVFLVLSTFLAKWIMSL